MADIDLQFLDFGDLKQQYLELDLRAGRPLIYGSEWFWIYSSFLDGLD